MKNHKEKKSNGHGSSIGLFRENFEATHRLQAHRPPCAQRHVRTHAATVRGVPGEHLNAERVRPRSGKPREKTLCQMWIPLQGRGCRQDNGRVKDDTAY